MTENQRARAISFGIDAQLLIGQVQGLGCNPDFIFDGIRTADDAEKLATQLLLYAKHLRRIAEEARDLSNMLDGLSDDLRSEEGAGV